MPRTAWREGGPQPPDPGAVLRLPVLPGVPDPDLVIRPSGSCGCPISCCGSPPMRSFISPTCCGPTSPKEELHRAIAALSEPHPPVWRCMIGDTDLVAVVLAPLFFVVLFFLAPVWLAVLMAAICALASFLNCCGPPRWPTTTGCMSLPPWRRPPSPWGAGWARGHGASGGRSAADGGHFLDRHPPV